MLSVGAMVSLAMVAGSLFAASEGPTNKPAKQAGSGTVTTIIGSTITVQGKKGSIIIDASKAKVITISAPAGAKPIVTNINLSDIKVGDTLRIQGTMSGNAVMATQIVDVTLGGGAGKSAPFGLGNQPQKDPKGKKPQGDGEQNKPENPTRCMDTCKEVGTNCISQIENGLKKQCDNDGIACRAQCDAQNFNDAIVTRACYSNCRPAEVACYDKVVAQESACTTTKDVCVMNCQKASKPEKPGKGGMPGGQEGPQGPGNCPNVGNGPGLGVQEGPNGRQTPPMSDDAKSAIFNNDFAGWVKAMTAEGPMPAPLKAVTQDNFSTFVQAFNLRTQAQDLLKKASDLMKSIGVVEEGAPQEPQPPQMP